MASRSAVQVVSVDRDANEGPSFGVLEENLNSVLLQNQAKDLPVVVLSIAGTYREGKSFFLNLVGEYLRNERRDNWLNSENVSMDCFHWQSGIRGVTSGLWLCPDPFVVTGPTGEKIAVLLMDSQGTFDTATSFGESAGVFALSALLSSVQIYNMKEKFSSENLDALKLFVDYGSAARGGGDNKLFKALQFLLRDWSNVQYGYGAEGGRQFLQEQQEIQQRRDGNTVLGEISGGFECVDCFLLPFPWNNYQSRDNREASITDLSAEFKTQITKLLSSMLQWDNLKRLVRQDMSGSTITTREILVYIKKYVEKFNSDELTSPKSALEANIEIALMKISEMSLEVFDKAVNTGLGDDVTSHPAEWLAALLDTARRDALDFYDAKVAAITNVALKAACRAKLEQEICARKLQVENDNNAKVSKEEMSRLKEDAKRVRIETERMLAEIERERSEEKKEMERVKADAEKTKRETEIQIETIKTKSLEEMKAKDLTIFELEKQKTEAKLKNQTEIEGIVKKHDEGIARKSQEYEENLKIKREESENRIKEVKINSEKNAREHFEKEIRKVKEELEEQVRKKQREADDRTQELKARRAEQDKKMREIQGKLNAAAQAIPGPSQAANVGTRARSIPAPEPYWPEEEYCSSPEECSYWPDGEDCSPPQTEVAYWPDQADCQPAIVCWPVDQSYEPCQPTIPYCPLDQSCQPCQPEILYCPPEEYYEPCQLENPSWSVEENCQPCQPTYWYGQ